MGDVDKDEIDLDEDEDIARLVLRFSALSQLKCFAVLPL